MPPTLRALGVPNFRRWYVGGILSTTGSWMQLVAQNWVVLQRTGSTSALGLSVMLQALPAATLGLWGGVIADRVPRRRLLAVTQTVSGLLAATLGVLMLTDALALWMLWLFALAMGLVLALDGPAAAAFAAELVDEEDLANGIALGSAANSLARIAGMALGGTLVALVGAGPVFLLNAVSYVAVIVALYRIDPRALRRAAPAMRARGQLREGLRYVAGERTLRVTVVLAFFLASFGRNFQVTMAAMTAGPLRSGAAGYGACSTVFAAGAFIGALVAARLGRLTHVVLIGAALAAGSLQLASGFAPDMRSFLTAMLPIAVCAVVIDTALATHMQLGCDGALRARVAAILGLAGTGGAALGGPMLGALAEALGPRTSLAVGGGVAATAATVAGSAFWLASGASFGSPAPAAAPI